MYTYSNGISLAINHPENELVLEFHQKMPLFEEKPDSILKENISMELHHLPVAQVVMSTAKGRELLEALQRLYPSES